MAKLPCAQQYIGKGMDLPAPELPDTCCNPTCDAPAFDVHHIVRRSFLGGPFDHVELFGRVWLNVAQVCRSCHDDLEQNRVVIAATLKGSSGFYSWAGRKLDPYPNPVLEDGESAGVFPPFHATGAGSPSSSTGVTEGEKPGDLPVDSSGEVTGHRASQAGSPSVTPGSTCPQCQRRVPHPRKPSSPKTKVYGMRIPTDEAETFAELVDSAAEYVGIKDQAHHKFRTISLAVAHLLQDEGLRGFGKR